MWSTSQKSGACLNVTVTIRRETISAITDCANLSSPSHFPRLSFLSDSHGKGKSARSPMLTTGSEDSVLISRQLQRITDGIMVLLAKLEMSS